MAMVRCELDRIWRKREAELNKDITFLEVAEYAGVHRDTISRLFKGETNRYDGDLIAKVAEYLGVEDGQPIPFLVLDTSKGA